MYHDAVKDGIRVIERKGVGYLTKYFPKCHICGQEVMTFSYSREVKYTCKACKFNELLSDKENREVSSHEAKEKKLENAIKRIMATTGSKAERERYEKPVAIVKKHLHRDGWFDSTEEIMVAIELLKHKISTRHQVKLGRYRADFVLPDEKIVLEVDGTVFHSERTMAKENLRDNLIVIGLGPEWEVIRITDELINQNIKRLVPAIRAAKREREKVRKANNGMLPASYSKRKI